MGVEPPRGRRFATISYFACFVTPDSATISSMSGARSHCREAEGEEETGMEKIWLKSYPQGIPPAISIGHVPSLVALFEQACATYADQVAYISLDKEMTYRLLYFLFFYF